ncbi:hypothetical protein, partial [Moraxella catarrhalis]|uniref:hypothetical protein n=1 Tax=Moraxella catarrhalis TaxID=480 RepID=UPI00128DCD64
MKKIYQFTTEYETQFLTEFQELLTAFESLQHEHNKLLSEYTTIAERNKNGKQYLTEQTQKLQKLDETIKKYNERQNRAIDIWNQRAESQEKLADMLESQNNMIDVQKKQLNSLQNILATMTINHQHEINDLKQIHQQQIETLTEQHREIIAKTNEKISGYQKEIERLENITMTRNRQINTLTEQQTILKTQINTLQSVNKNQEQQK